MSCGRQRARLSACPEGASLAEEEAAGVTVRQPGSPFPVYLSCVISSVQQLCRASGHVERGPPCFILITSQHPHERQVLEFTFQLENLRHRKVSQGDPEPKRRPTDSYVLCHPVLLPLVLF